MVLGLLRTSKGLAQNTKALGQSSYTPAQARMLRLSDLPLEGPWGSMN